MSQLLLRLPPGRARWALLSFGAMLAIAAATGAGLLDRWASDGRIDRTAAIGALAVCWFVFFLSVYVVPTALRHRKQAALVLLSIAAALVVSEIVSRLFVGGTTAVRMSPFGLRSRELHHVYPARSHMYMGRFEGNDVFVDTNEDGLRTTYSRGSFTTYQHRVIVLGDSFVFGLGVTSEDSLPQRLEQDLRRVIRNETLAVLNAGITSYSPFLEKLLFEKRLEPYRPTLVVLVLDATDIGDDYLYMRQARQASGAPEFADSDAPPRAYYGALYELLRPYAPQFEAPFKYPVRLVKRVARIDGTDTNPRGRDYYDFEVSVGGTTEKNRFFIYRHPLDATRRFFDETMRNVDEIAALSSRVGARFVLTVTPRFHHWNASECPDNWEKDSYRLNEPYQYEYFRYFDESARPYAIVNLLPDFQAARQYPLVFRQDPHWNAAGHAFAASALARHLVRQGTFSQLVYNPARLPNSRRSLPYHFMASPRERVSSKVPSCTMRSISPSRIARPIAG